MKNMFNQTKISTVSQ